jgi:hypothetical protein
MGMASERRGDAAREFWRGLIERQAASGLSIGPFCDRTGVSTASFHAWKRKLKLRSETSGRDAEAGVPSPIVPVRVIGDVDPATIAVELPGGIVIRIPANADSALLRAAAFFACELMRGVTGPC